MKCRAVIFDLDGTLVDTIDDLADAGNRVLEDMGFEKHTTAAYKYFIGEGLRNLVMRITPDSVSDTVIDECCVMFERYYAECWNCKSRVYEGIVVLLRALRNRGIRCSVLSNKPHHFTRTCVDHFFEPTIFEHVFGQREGVEKKPSPAGALEIAELMRVTPKECLYVGDSSIDMQTGKSAGMYTIGVLWGFRDAEELQKNRADMLVQQPSEIIEFIERVTV